MTVRTGAYQRRWRDGRVCACVWLVSANVPCLLPLLALLGAFSVAVAAHSTGGVFLRKHHRARISWRRAAGAVLGGKSCALTACGDVWRSAKTISVAAFPLATTSVLDTDAAGKSALASVGHRGWQASAGRGLGQRHASASNLCAAFPAACQAASRRTRETWRAQTRYIQRLRMPGAAAAAVGDSVPAAVRAWALRLLRF